MLEGDSRHSTSRPVEARAWPPVMAPEMRASAGAGRLEMRFVALLVRMVSLPIMIWGAVLGGEWGDGSSVVLYATYVCEWAGGRVRARWGVALAPTALGTSMY